MSLRTLSVLLLHLSSLCFRLGAASASCSCSSVIVPVHVDALVPKDPSDVLGGLKSNSTSLRRVHTTYDIYGVFCRPDAGNEGLSQSRSWPLPFSMIVLSNCRLRCVAAPSAWILLYQPVLVASHRRIPKLFLRGILVRARSAFSCRRFVRRWA